MIIHQAESSWQYELSADITRENSNLGLLSFCVRKEPADHYINGEPRKITQVDNKDAKAFIIHCVNIAVNKLQAQGIFDISKIYGCVRVDFNFDNVTKLMDTVRISTLTDFIDDDYYVESYQYRILPLHELYELIKRGNVI